MKRASFYALTSVWGHVAHTELNCVSVLPARTFCTTLSYHIGWANFLECSRVTVATVGLEFEIFDRKHEGVRVRSMLGKRVGIECSFIQYK
jgi:hypothetical protein